MSLYSKYRPQNFANLVGQDHVRQTLLNEIQNGTFSHAYLFAGPRGTGKTSTARLIAKALNCEKKNEAGEPCDACDFCLTIKDGSLIDVIEIDAASNRGIDEIRELKEKIQFAPTRAKSKTYIIDEVHMLTKEAFNALLKTLEEPPENVFFILATTEVHKIPETIISRCQRFDFKRIDVKTIMTRLNFIAQNEGIAAEDAAIELIARHVEGGLRDAIGLLEQIAMDGKLLADRVRSHLGVTGHDTVFAFIGLLEKKDTAGSLHLINEVHREGYDLTAFVREILECLRERLIESVQTESKNSGAWLTMIERFEEARDMLRGTVIPQLPLEIAAIKICGAAFAMTAAVTAKSTSSAASEKPAVALTETPEPLKVTATLEAQKAEEETAGTLKKEFETEAYQGDLAKAWPRVLEHVQPPSLRRSLTEAKFSQDGQDGPVTLTFGAKFHIERVNLVESRSKIEKAIEHLCGKKLKVSCELDPLGATQEMQKSEKKTAAPKKEKAEESKNPIKTAMEIFGNDE